MPSPSSWNNGVEKIPDLSEQDVIEITRYVNNEKKCDIKEVESVEQSLDEYWSEKVHFLDGSMLRTNEDSNWQWYTIYQRAYPLRGIEVLQNN